MALHPSNRINQQEAQYTGAPWLTQCTPMRIECGPSADTVYTDASAEGQVPERRVKSHCCTTLYK